MISGILLELGLWDELGSRNTSPGLLDSSGCSRGFVMNRYQSCNVPSRGRDPHTRSDDWEAELRHYASPSRPTTPTPRKFQIWAHSLKIFLYKSIAFSGFYTEKG